MPPRPPVISNPAASIQSPLPCVAEYGGGDACKTAYYMLRWSNTREEKGPRSQTVSATIPG